MELSCVEYTLQLGARHITCSSRDILGMYSTSLRLIVPRLPTANLLCDS